MTHVYLDIDQVLEIHHAQIEDTGGSHGIMNIGALESALARPRSGYYDGLIQEASALLESLAINHAFYDGNKRVAFVATATFLELNRYRIECDPEESDQFVRNMVMTKQNRFDRIVDWLTSHTSPL